MKANLDRRNFIKSAGAGIVAGALGNLASPNAGFCGEKDDRIPADTIIDTHTHFYDPSRSQGVPWPDPNDKLLYRTVLPEHYQALAKPQPVTGTVVVEASPWLEDNQWILDLAAREPFLVGLVGNLNPGGATFSGHLNRLAANRLFRGIRIGHTHLQQGLDQPSFIGDLKQLVAKDLELDVNGPPAMLPEVDRLARKLPELRIVINHVANLKIDGKAVPSEWRRGMQAAAQHRQVYCKVSGLVEGTGRSDGTAPSDPEYYRPVLDSIWQDFGEDRLVYGSNWPVSERFAPLATVQQIVRRYFQSKGAGAVEKCFWQNARAVYKWRQVK